MEVKIKAYGKMLIFGAYSILEPENIGLVVNVNKGTTTTVQETDSGKIVFDLKNFKMTLTGEINGHKILLKKNPEMFKFMKNAVELTFEYLKIKKIRIKDINLISQNDEDIQISRNVKTGFGSSATSTVSAVAAILALHGIKDRDIVYKISRYAHYKSQGNGSGFDIFSACYGSTFFLSENMDFDMDFIDFVNQEIKRQKGSFYWPSNLQYLIAFSGKSASTKKFITKVNHFKKKNPKEYFKFMKRYNQVNLECHEAFLKNNMNNIICALEKSWQYRKKLAEFAKINLEPGNFSKLLGKLKEMDASAGFVGAGGGDSLIVLFEDLNIKEELIKYLENKSYVVMQDLFIVNKEYEVL